MSHHYPEMFLLVSVSQYQENYANLGRQKKTRAVSISLSVCNTCIYIKILLGHYIEQFEFKDYIEQFLKFPYKTYLENEFLLFLICYSSFVAAVEVAVVGNSRSCCRHSSLSPNLLCKKINVRFYRFFVIRITFF